MRARQSKTRLTLFDSLSLMTFVFSNDLYFEKASVSTFSVQSFETSDTNRRNHFGSHSASVSLRRKGEGRVQVSHIDGGNQNRRR